MVGWLLVGVPLAILVYEKMKPMEAPLNNIEEDKTIEIKRAMARAMREEFQKKRLEMDEELDKEIFIENEYRIKPEDIDLTLESLKDIDFEILKGYGK